MDTENQHDTAGGPVGPTRRTVLTRAAMLAGTTAWALPTVQVLSMGPASADLASGEEEPETCTTPPPSARATAETLEVMTPVRTSGPAGSAGQTGEGTATPANGGPGTVTTVVVPGLGMTADVMSAVTSASVLPAGGPADARSAAAATVEQVLLTLPDGSSLVVRTLVSSAEAKVTSAGVPTSDATSSVASLTLISSLGIEQTLAVPATGSRDVLGFVRLFFGEEQTTFDPLTRTVQTTVTALRIVTLAPLPAAEVVVARSTARAAFPPVCVVPPVPKP